MLKAYKYRLTPNKAQKMLLSKHFGCARFVYNWGLSEKKRLYEDDKQSISYVGLANKMASELKNEYEWLNEVNSQSLQASLKNLDTAYKNFFDRLKKGKTGINSGFPKFKSKRNKQSFQCPQHSKVSFEKGKLSLVKIPNIKCNFHRNFEGKIKTVTISLTPSGEYYASILVETELQEIIPPCVIADKTIGIDVGIKTFAVVSNGIVFENPKHLAISLKKLQKLSKQHSKKVKGSKNREKISQITRKSSQSKVRFFTSNQLKTCQR
jgi:putative transposase